MRQAAILIMAIAAIACADIPIAVPTETRGTPTAGPWLDPFSGGRTRAPATSPASAQAGYLCDDGPEPVLLDLLPVKELPFGDPFDALDVVITQSSAGVAALAADYTLDGTMWVAASFRADSACRVFKSTDNGSTWNYFGGFTFPARALVRRLDLVVGYGDSARVYLFALHPDNHGDLTCARWEMDGSGLTGYGVLVGPDTITEFAACRDYSAERYRLYAVAHNGRNSTAFPRSLICRSMDFARTWTVVDTMANCAEPRMTAGPGSYIYISAAPIQSIWRGYVGAVISDNYGAPGSWTSRVARPDTHWVFDASISPAYTWPPSDAMVWLSYTDLVEAQNRYRVLALHSSNAGRDWHGPTLVSGEPSLDAVAGHLRCYTSHGDNNMYISYWRFYEVYRRHVTASAPTEWSDPVKINDSHRSHYGFGLTPLLNYASGRSGPGVVWVSEDSTRVLWNAPWMTALSEPPGSVRIGGDFVVAPSPATSRLQFNWPGPAADITLFDAAGRELRRFRAKNPGFAWDRRDEAGRRFPAGIYFARLELPLPAGSDDTAPAGKATRAVVLR